MSKGHHVLQEEGFCNGISEIKDDINVNSVLNDLGMVVASLTFNVIRNSVYYCQGTQTFAAQQGPSIHREQHLTAHIRRKWRGHMYFEF